MEPSDAEEAGVSSTAEGRRRHTAWFIARCPVWFSPGVSVFSVCVGEHRCTQLVYIANTTSHRQGSCSRPSRGCCSGRVRAHSVCAGCFRVFLHSVWGGGRARALRRKIDLYTADEVFPGSARDRGREGRKTFSLLSFPLLLSPSCDRGCGRSALCCMFILRRSRFRTCNQKT